MNSLNSDHSVKKTTAIALSELIQKRSDVLAIGFSTINYWRGQQILWWQTVMAQVIAHFHAQRAGQAHDKTAIEQSPIIIEIINIRLKIQGAVPVHLLIELLLVRPIVV